MHIQVLHGKKAEFNFAPFRRTILYSCTHFSHSSFSVIQNPWDQWWSWDSRRQRFLQVHCCDLSGYYDWYCSTGSLPSSFQKFGHIVLSSCGLIHSLLPQEGCWEPLAGIQEAKQNTTPPALAYLHWETAATASGRFGFFLDKFCLPSFLPPLFKKQQLDSTAANAH